MKQGFRKLRFRVSVLCWWNRECIVLRGLMKEVVMKRILSGAVLALAVVVASPAWAGFDGQTILGPLGLGSSVDGNTVGANDDNDGWTSGDHFFFIWNGPDDAWALNWPGGNLSLELTYDNTFADLDVFLYSPGGYDDAEHYGIANSGVENVDVPGAAAGLYYIVVDSEDDNTAGAYHMNITPEPGTILLLGAGVAFFARRRK
jgi:hypothetical protein